MDSREIVAAETLGSLRAEGLEPSSETEELVESWVRGEIDNSDLERAEDAIVDAATVRPAQAL